MDIINYKKHLVTCPHCGRDILDHMTECPFCHNAVAIKGGLRPMAPEKLKRIKHIANIVGFIIAGIIIVLVLIGKAAS